MKDISLVKGPPDPDETRARLMARLAAVNTLPPKGASAFRQLGGRRGSGGPGLVMPHTNVRPIVTQGGSERKFSWGKARIAGTYKRPPRAVPKSRFKRLRGPTGVVKTCRIQEPEEKPKEGQWSGPKDFIKYLLTRDTATDEFCYMTRPCTKRVVSRAGM
ncbi:hypothetical protein Pmar_PMAR013228 [Perkinsus marinus ATCC 50983]|uniref:Uncharacterized protein n=1 Tax=Perkinsus marinus (strain ATCC 50983 / TXsc) TaxID=423536 RepID=C5LET8_PERM5|nr:hypothetical protein Pmar_PMAR013228 [Perkinsus marinus ATCC 50983]EER04704.1 hypothetical protein Pmar_PMAR013228 [Perkinsus marinus ATCC 50983]|eukprot:XP_002772888.1 hypothetical protein Pmar_PMAR013228 [Perkinsus marinus ATCC 50983]